MASCKGVMLGIPDEKISFEDDISNTWTTNKFGGVPNWINKAPDVGPQCNLCGHDLPMIAQIYCPLQNSPCHRVLYVFGCVNSACWNKNTSWKVLRCQSLAKNDEPQETERDVLKEDAWCDDADDWGEDEMFDEANATTALEQLEEQTKSLNLSEIERPNHNSSLKTSIKSSTPGPEILINPCFVPYYITVLDESHLLSEVATLTWSEKRLLDEYRSREGLHDVDGMLDASTGGGWGGEKYELGVAKHGDKIFQKFRKQLSLCPNQCLRYSWNGDPLLMTSQGLRTIPSCTSCGEKRVFELQLMPALVSLLKLDIKKYKTVSLNDNKTASRTPNNGQNDSKQNAEINQLSSECIEFGTVFVYTCSQGCWSGDAQYMEEYVIVHSDPDQHLFKSAK